MRTGFLGWDEDDEDDGGFWDAHDARMEAMWTRLEVELWDED